MNHINGLVSSCILVLAASGCSALTKWPDVNDNTATKGGTAGSTGEDEFGGSATRGGTSSKGGATNLGGTSAAGKASTGGIENSAGTSSNSGGATNVGGTTNVGGAASSNGGATTIVAGTSSTIGGAATATGGIASITLGGQGGSSVVGTGGKSVSGGATSSAVGGVSAQGGVATQGGASGTSTVAGTGGTGSTVQITSTELDSGSYNVAYTTTLAASGGTGTGFTWSLRGGTLPKGLSVSTTGVISGTPLEDGAFPFTVSVTDAAGAVDTQELNLAISRKRWIAIISDQVTSGVNLPYLVDISDPSLKRTDLSSVVGAGCSAKDLRFSPDGNYLQFQVGSGTGCSLSTLYVVDVSQKSPGTPYRIDLGPKGIQRSCGWSADSQWVAYFGDTGTSNEVVIASRAQPSILSTSVGSPASVRTCFWMNATRLTWLDDQYYLSTTNGNGTSWSLATSSSRQYGLGEVIGASKTDLVALRVPKDVTYTEVLNLSSDTTSEDFGQSASISGDLTLVADAGSVIKTMTGASAGVLTTYQPGAPISWANHSNRLVLGPTASAAVFADLTGSVATTQTIVSSAGYAKVLFSPTDTRVAFISPSQVGVAATSGSSVGTISVISSSLPSGGTLSGNAVFAPNSRGIVYTGQQATAGTTEAFLVDLTNPSPSAPRKVNTEVPAGTTIATVGWTQDSSAVYYVYGGLNIVNVVESGAIPKKVVPKFTEFAVQP